MALKRTSDQQDDDAPPLPSRQLTPYERASIDMLIGITNSNSGENITIERCVDDVDFTVVSRWVLSRSLYACWLSTLVNLPVERGGCDIVLRCK
ncbi:hypothetical protein F511_16546 [Dorcoceras hygrometricum]|uniref:Uncharacterized protein n=1 Tax=Dorcoceras hygrometricum TaxID=472368 RepID=A0A2Z7DGA1_9LAMI|nr:hypothetical protein F511_16546 [Dorcoceras hygrometricum]